MENSGSAIDDDLKHVVDEVMQEYSNFDNGFSFFSPTADNFIDQDKVKEEQKIMKSDAVITNEINSDVWDRAFRTCLGDTTPFIVPHFTVLQKCICFILNAEKLDFGLSRTLLSKILFFHSPNTPAMQTYYWHILNDPYVVLQQGSVESENIFSITLNYLVSSLENPECFAGAENQVLGIQEFWNNDPLGRIYFCLSAQLYFKELPVYKQFERAFLVFEYICELLERDFVHRVKTNTVHTETSRCYLSRLLWENEDDIGTLTSPVKKLTKLFILMEDSNEHHTGQLHKRFLVLLAEFFRYIDKDKNCNPQVKNKANNLISDLSLKLFEGLKNNYNPEGMRVLKTIKPHWFRLAISSKWLSYITCRLWPPELSSVLEVLKDVWKMTSKRRIYRTIYGHTTRKSKKREWNTEDRSFFHRKIRFCGDDCMYRERRVFKDVILPPENVNEVDSYGWAPIHRAVLLGHEMCVQNMLHVSRQMRSPEETVDGRLPGYKRFTPLMCALTKEQGKMCRSLLEYSGHGLLEDINLNGDSAFDMRDDKDIGRFMSSRGGINVHPERWKNFYFSFDDVPLVTQLCVMIAESYFTAYKIPDVLARLRIYKYGLGGSDMEESEETNWDYERYEKDINVNIFQLSELLTKFPEGSQVKTILKPLDVLLNSCSNP